MDPKLHADAVISILSNPKGKWSKVQAQDVQILVSNCKKIFLSEPSLLELKPPLTIVGDLHGQFLDLLKILAMEGYPPTTHFLFLGDYVDRGSQGLEIMILLTALKVRYPNHIHLIRGNHETQELTHTYGFYEECLSKMDSTVYDEWCELFNTIPFGALIAGKILCLHGGISPELKTLDQIRQIKRPTTIPEKGFLTDLVWTDPNHEIEEWGPNDRGNTFEFGQAPLKRFLDSNKLALLVRAHQMVLDGIDYPFRPSRNIMTVFSAPHYTGLNNKGAIMKIDKSFKISTTLIQDNAPATNVTKKPSLTQLS